MLRIAGSFRDPAGYVVKDQGRYNRVITSIGAPQYEAARACLQALAAEQRLVAFEEVPVPAGVDASYVLRQDTLPFVSYPYEWSFFLLRTAALFHLELHLDLLKRGFTLSDASAYNVQFRGVRPIFIDHLSVREYRDGEFWLGHRQFCEQFLLPLLLRAKFDVPHNSWLRGAMEGIPTRDFVRLLSWWQKLTPRVLAHVVLPDSFDRQPKARSRSSEQITERRLPLSSYRGLLQQLHSWIASLKPAAAVATTWANYERDATYDSDERQAKHAFVSEAVRASGAKRIIDLGCNTGEYSELCLAAGAQSVIGFDFDQQSLDGAFLRAQTKQLAFTPLYLDARNPSPDQGWMQGERSGMKSRFDADMVIALAFEHHLAIAHNVPLAQVVEWVMGFAVAGVIEFVPKSDPTIQTMLALRQDIFPNYTQDEFERCLGARHEVIAKRQVSASGRTLYRVRLRD